MNVVQEQINQLIDDEIKKVEESATSDLLFFQFNHIIGQRDSLVRIKEVINKYLDLGKK